MATKLYLHAASSGHSNLPSSEQSTLTANLSADSAGTNRSMDSNAGTSVSSLAIITAASTNLQTLYYGRFVSPKLNNVTSDKIEANTWDYRFVTSTTNAAANFPCTGANRPVYINCYVWNTSNGTKRGTILDGNSNTNFSEPSSTAGRTTIGTFAGAEVAGIGADDVIIFEVWFRVTQGNAVGRTDTFFFDGATEIIIADVNNSSAASHLNTPQGSLFSTKLVFHAETSGFTGLPSTEQSSLTSNKNVDAQSVNRIMNSDSGTSMVSLTLASNGTNSTQNYYFTKFVSPKLDQTSVSANTWIYAFAASQPNASANFPADDDSLPVRVNCYVWNTDTQTKVGTILDGNTNSTYAEPATTGTIRSMYGTFSGAAVSSIPANSVIVFEVWFIITQGNTTSYNDVFYYDGSTVIRNTNTIVTDYSSFIETPEFISFAIPTQLFERTAGETIVVSAGVARMLSASRTVSATAVVEAVVARMRKVQKTANETIESAAEVVRMFFANRSLSETLEIDSVVARISSFFRTIQESFTVDDEVQEEFIPGFEHFDREVQETLEIGGAVVTLRKVIRTIGESLTIDAVAARISQFIRVLEESLTVEGIAARMLDATRSLSESLEIQGNVAKISYFFGSLSESLEIDAAVARLRRVPRTINEILELDAQVARMLSAFRTVAESFTVEDVVDGAKSFSRTVDETFTIITDVVRQLFANRTLSESFTIDAIVAKMLSAFRTLSESFTIEDVLSTSKAFVKTVDETLMIDAQVVRMLRAFRTLSESLEIDATVARIKTFFRTLAENLEIDASVVFSRLVARTLSETVAIDAIVARILSIFRTLSESLVVVADAVSVRKVLRSISESLTVDAVVARMRAIDRSISETLEIDAAVARVLDFFRTVNETVTVNATVAIVRKVIRSISESFTIDAVVAKSQAITRSVSESFTIITDVVQESGLRIVRSVNESFTIVANLSILTCWFNGGGPMVYVVKKVGRFFSTMPQRTARPYTPASKFSRYNPREGEEV